MADWLALHGGLMRRGQRHYLLVMLSDVINRNNGRGGWVREQRMPGGLASEGRGLSEDRGPRSWHDNGCAARLSLNKAGVFPRFAAFWAFLLRLECGLLERD